MKHQTGILEQRVFAFNAFLGARGKLTHLNNERPSNLIAMAHWPCGAEIIRASN